MRARLSPEALEELGTRYRAAYYQLSVELYFQDRQHPEAVRGIAWRELANLLAAVYGALARGDDNAADFAVGVGRFLHVFGRTRDRAALQARAEVASDTLGSDAWYLTQSNRGEQLQQRGQFAPAETVFAAILGQLGATPSQRRGTTLAQLARCHDSQGRSDLAEASIRQALREVATLRPDRDVHLLQSTLHADLGNVLSYRGDLDGAEAEHEAAIAIEQELGDVRGVAVGNGQLGTIFMRRRDFTRAAQSYWDAIAAFTRLNEPASVAVGYHQLGNVHLEASALAEAETAYREAARIRENLGDRLSAAGTWMNLAVTIERQGRRVADVEQWYRKALAVFDEEHDQVRKSRTLNNLANLLRGDPARLAEARALAEQALATKQTLDPGIAEIWTTHANIAAIAGQQGDADAARRHHMAERRSFAAAPIAKETLRRFRPLIDAMLAALRPPPPELPGALDGEPRRPSGQPAAELEPVLAQMAEDGWTNLVTALRALLAGTRNEEALCDPLDHADALIVTAILHCLANPGAEANLPPAG
jgi:tetratricopeptide (TPR) repeat protein